MNDKLKLIGFEEIRKTCKCPVLIRDSYLEVQGWDGRYDSGPEIVSTVIYKCNRCNSGWAFSSDPTASFQKVPWEEVEKMLGALEIDQRRRTPEVP